MLLLPSLPLLLPVSGVGPAACLSSHYLHFLTRARTPYSAPAAPLTATWLSLLLQPSPLPSPVHPCCPALPPATDCHLASEYGRHVGLAFQLVDDIMDFTSSGELQRTFLPRVCRPVLLGAAGQRLAAA